MRTLQLGILVFSIIIGSFAIGFYSLWRNTQTCEEMIHSMDEVQCESKRINQYLNKVEKELIEAHKQIRMLEEALTIANMEIKLRQPPADLPPRDDKLLAKCKIDGVSDHVRVPASVYLSYGGSYKPVYAPQIAVVTTQHLATKADQQWCEDFKRVAKEMVDAGQLYQDSRTGLYYNPFDLNCKAREIIMRLEQLQKDRNQQK